MTATKQEALAALHNRATRYELAAIKGEQRLLVSYTAQRSRQGMLHACRNRAEHIIRVAQVSPDTLLMFQRIGTGQGYKALMGDWAIQFTGRTQREAIMNGELPWIAEVARG